MAGARFWFYISGTRRVLFRILINSKGHNLSEYTEMCTAACACVPNIIRCVVLCGYFFNFFQLRIYGCAKKEEDLMSGSTRDGWKEG